MIVSFSLSPSTSLFHRTRSRRATAKKYKVSQMILVNERFKDEGLKAAVHNDTNVLTKLLADTKMTLSLFTFVSRTLVCVGDDQSVLVC